MSKKSRSVRLGVEILESREMMAANLQATLLSDGLLRVEGTEANDTILVRQDAGKISVVGASISTIAGLSSQIDAAAVNRIEVYGLGGNDVIRLDQGAQAITVPGFLDGGAGNDILAGGAGPDMFRIGNTEADRAPGFGANDQLLFTQPGVIQKAQVASDGAIVSLSTDNVLWADGTVIESNVKSFAIDPDGKTIYMLQTDGDFYRLDRPSGSYAYIFNAVKSFAAAPDGKTFYMLQTDGDFYRLDGPSGNYAYIFNAVDSYSAASDGKTFYVLQTDGDFYRLDGPSGNYAYIFNAVDSYSAAPDGKTLYMLQTDGDFYRLDGPSGNYAYIFNAVDSYSAAPDGKTFYVLQTDGDFYRLDRPSGNYAYIFNAVKSFAAAPDGKTFYMLQTDDDFYQLDGPTGNYTSISSSVKQFAVGGAKLFWLAGTDGRLYERAIAGGDSMQITPSKVMQFQVTADKLFWLEETDGRLYERATAGGNSAQITSTVTQFQVTADKLFWLEGTDGRLYERAIVGGNPTQITSTVTQFQLSADKLFWLEGTDGRLYQRAIAGGNYAQISSTVMQFQLSADKLFWLEGPNGRLYERAISGGNYAQISSTVTQFQVTADKLFWLEGTNGRLYERAISGGNYAQIGDNVTKFALTPDGTLYALNTGNLLYDMPLGGSSIQQVVLSSLSNTSWTVGKPGYSGTISVNGLLCSNPNLMVTTKPASGLIGTLSGNTITISGTAPTQSGTLRIDVSVSVPGIPWAVVERTYNLSLNPDAPSKLFFLTQPPSVSAVGSAFSTVLQVVDQYGNNVPGVAVTVGSTTVITDVKGCAAFNNLSKGAAGTYTLTASVAGLGNVTSNSITVYQPAPASISISGVASTMTVGQVSPVTITVKDQYGKAYSGPVTISNSNAAAVSLSSTTVSTNTNGQATVNLTAIHSGNVNGVNVTLAVIAGGVRSEFSTTVFPSMYNWQIQCTVTYTDQFGTSSFDTDPTRWPYSTTAKNLADASAEITFRVSNQFHNQYGTLANVTVHYFSYTAAN